MQSLGTGCCGGVFDRDLLKIKNKILKKKGVWGIAPRVLFLNSNKKVSMFQFLTLFFQVRFSACVG